MACKGPQGIKPVRRPIMSGLLGLDACFWLYSQRAMNCGGWKFIFSSQRNPEKSERAIKTIKNPAKSIIAPLVAGFMPKNEPTPPKMPPIAVYDTNRPRLYSKCRREKPVFLPGFLAAIPAEKAVTSPPHMPMQWKLARKPIRRING